MTPPLKWHGGKHYLAERLIALMPAHKHYVEPFFGGGSVMLAKDAEGVSEVANDIHRLLTNFWRVLQQPESFRAFERCVQCIPFSKPEYEWSHWWTRHFEQGDNLLQTEPIMAATAFFVQCRQSLAGRMTTFAPLSRSRTRRGMNEQASAWMNAIAGLREVHNRLRRVVVYNENALDVIAREDGPDTLFYLDPPYLQETRAAPKVYSHEMTHEQHAQLLELLRHIKGRFLLSGYPSGLYDSVAALAGWTRQDFELPNNAAGGAEKRVMTECVWKNY